MSLSATIASRIEQLPEDTTFRYQTLEIPRDKYATAAKVLERLQTKGIIKKLSKGIFYKPRQTVFGELRPGDEAVIKDYLYENGKRRAYLTGTYLYNQMGLTTQVPSVWRIASFNNRIFVQRGNIKATPVKSYVPISDENYRLLEFLDALKDWNTIQDLDQRQGVRRLLQLLDGFKSEQLRELLQYAILYPPRVAAFLGALLEFSRQTMKLDILREKLNPLTTYRLNISSNNLSTILSWNIV